MENTDIYIQKPLEERQKHIDLSECCLERGGSSTNHKGVLAQYLDTTIPGLGVDLCHACGNGKCSNPRHLYWGTRKENVHDAIVHGTFKTAWQRRVEKYGLEEAKRMNALGDKSAGGRGNKGKPKSLEHRRKISEAIKRLRG